MTKKKYIILMLVYWFTMVGVFTAALEARSIIPMPDFVNPYLIMSDETQFYVVENDAVSIFRADDFRLLKKFGRRGEGPQEFNISPSGRINFTLSSDKLIVYTYTKFLEYKKDGTYIREVRKQDLKKEGYTGNFYVFGDYFLLKSLAPGSKPFEEISFYLCDSKFNKIKEINRGRFPVNILARKIYKYTPSIQPKLYKDMAFFPVGKNFEIIGLNTEGKTFLHIKHDYKPLKVTKNHIEEFHEYFKTSHPNRTRYESRKKWWVFPEYFPSIRTIHVANYYIYVRTYKTNEKKDSEFLVFDLKGKYLETIFLPVKPGPLEPPYPFLIKDGKFIQLIEDLENETWNLHITPIK